MRSISEKHQSVCMGNMCNTGCSSWETYICSFSALAACLILVVWEWFVCCIENGVDGLAFTRSWLIRSADRVKTRQFATESAADAEVAAAASSEASASSSSTLPVTSTAANATLNAAFLELLDWDDDRVFPEVISTLSVILEAAFVFYTLWIVRAYFCFAFVSCCCRNINISFK